MDFSSNKTISMESEMVNAEDVEKVLEELLPILHDIADKYDDNAPLMISVLMSVIATISIQAFAGDLQDYYDFTNHLRKELLDVVSQGRRDWQ